MQLELTDKEAAALLAALRGVIDNDRYPLSTRIRALRAIRGKLRVRSPNRHRSGHRERAELDVNLPAAAPIGLPSLRVRTRCIDSRFRSPDGGLPCSSRQPLAAYRRKSRAQPSAAAPAAPAIEVVPSD
jgi:hypothetical protein